MAFVGLWGYSNLLHHHMRAPSTRIIRYPFHAGLLRPNPSLPTVSRGFISRSNPTPPTQLDRRGRTWHQFHQLQHVLLFAVPPIKDGSVTCMQPSPCRFLFSDSIQLLS
jgi:hypothetical protein